MADVSLTNVMQPAQVSKLVAQALQSNEAVAVAEKPGSIIERWPVKTGQDPGAASLTLDVADTTVSELGAFARPSQWTSIDTDPPVALQTTRVAPAETTVWRVKVKIVGLRLESDGDYHLELQDSTGAMMIAEIPLPKPQYIGNNNRLAPLIAAARTAADNQFQKTVKEAQLAQSTTSNKLVPASAVIQRNGVAAVAPVQGLDLAAMTADPSTLQTFAMSIAPVDATITGIGFFDKYHGQAGNAPNIIELHPVLDLQFGS